MTSPGYKRSVSLRRKVKTMRASKNFECIVRTAQAEIENAIKNGWPRGVVLYEGVTWDDVACGSLVDLHHWDGERMVRDTDFIGLLRRLVRWVEGQGLRCVLEKSDVIKWGAYDKLLILRP